MNTSGFFVRRPIFTSMIVLIVMLIGLVSLSRLPVDLVPDISLPTLTVSTTYAGAGPEEIEELISRPVEEVAGSVPGAEEVTSESREGSSRVRITFAFGTNLSDAASDVRERIDRLITRLPEDADRPQLLKFDLASFPIVILGVESQLSPLETRLLMDNEVKNRLEKVPGVASMDALGGLVREIHVDMGLSQMIALGIPFQDILSRIRAGNIQAPAGPIARDNLDVNVRTPGEFRSVDQIADTIVTQRDGAAVRLRDVAEVKDTNQRVTNFVRINGKDGVRVAIRKQSGSNTVEVANRVLKEIDAINRDFPQIKMVPLIDSSKYIRTSLSNVASSIVYGGVLSVLVLFAFLGNLRTTLVIATSIPVAILATFILMYVSKFTLNIYSLGGLALGVGMLVDNSTVVLENIFRRFELGENAVEAAERGGNEVAASITAGTLTTVAVFLPLIFVQGMSGVLFQQMAYIVTFSMICSLVAALTLVPMITALVLKNMKRKSESGKQDFAFLRWLDDNYRAAIAWTLSHRLLVCGAVGLVLLVSLGLGRFIPTEFMPVADEGEVRVNGEMQVGTRVEVVAEKFKLIEEIVRQEVPEATDVLTELGATGFGGGNSAHTGQLRIYLKPQSERKRSSAQIANALRKPLANIPGMVVRTRPGQGLYVLRLASGGNTDRLQVDIRGYDLAKSAELAEQVSNLMKDIPGIRDAQISREFGTPEEQIIIDRDKAAALGLTIQDVASALQTVLTGTQAGNYREGGKEYVILVKIADAERLSLNELLQMTLNNNQGQPVMLSNVIKTQPGLGPVSIARKEQERVITVSADTADRPVDQITADLDRRLREMNLPPDFTVGLAGDIEEQQKSFQQLALSLILSLALIYMIMAAQYESLLHPFVVMFAVPLSAIGVILTLLATNTSLNLQSFIGIIMLGGIVVNNAIILVDTINQLRRDHGMELRAAVEEAGYRRLRPILMTTLTTLLGLVPLALGIGEGAEAQAPMARTVIGGLASSTLFTLFVVPIFYFTFEGWASRWQQRRQSRPGGLSHEV